MSTRGKVLIGFGVWLLGAVVLVVLLGSEGKNEEFTPTDEFKLDPWVDIKIGPIDMSINKAVLYLVLACGLTAWAMTYIARKMTSNLIGYIPLPTNTEHSAEIFGIEVPTLALYAATANISVPVVLTLLVWFAYQFEGIRAKGFLPYVRGLIPAGTPGPLKAFVFVIEVISQFVRIISLSVRLFANILAGHMLILFMAGGLAVILGIAALGWLTLPLAIIFFLLEVGLVATLQAFIFATLASIYFGEATAAHH